MEKPPCSPIAVAVAHVSAKGTSVGGTAGRTNAVSSTEFPCADSTTARYDPAGTPRRDVRSGESLPFVQAIAEIGAVQVLRIRSEGKRNKRVEIALK